MEEEQKIDWIEKMIEREATPKSLRTNTIEEFCKEYGVAISTYSWNAVKKENQKRILKVCLSLAKKGTPEVLEKLREKAEAGDMKAIDMFLNYVLELSKNLDIKVNNDFNLTKKEKEKLDELLKGDKTEIN